MTAPFTTRALLLEPGALHRRLSHLDCIDELTRRQPKTLAAVVHRVQLGVHNHYVDGMPRVLPMIAGRARGAYLADVDGNTFVDLDNGRGANILGHAPAVVTDALRAALDDGLSFAAGHETETALMGLLLDAVDWAGGGFFGNSGTEATMHALKLARTYTGRPLVAMFDQCYHGHHNDVLATRAPDGSTVGSMPGTARPASTLVLPYDRRAFEVIEARARELACVIVEPIRSSWPQLDRDFLFGLREVTAQHGVLLVFDEVLTGFRFRFGGALGTLGPTPDLATFGKIIGGGLPIGATVGRAEVIEMGVSTGEHLRDMQDRTRILGTFCGNILSCTAGLAQLRYLREHQDSVYATIHAAAERFAGELQRLRDEAGFPIAVRRYESLVRPMFGTMGTDEFVDLVHPQRYPVAEYMWTYYLRAAGVHLPEFLYPLFTAAHDTVVMDAVCEAVTRSVAGLRRDGLL
ncbi:aminotransferase class III-fold pyridoxal phosphate-dependent enzyme [[Mycobacterium] fortunisiensis]|nr:aminotransferase class III-fold pyridoxal phosphate-dependent enzyme [[Mycobacterium] fortunisiensis]